MKTTSVIFTAPCVVEVVDEELGQPKDTEVVIRTQKSLISTGTELTMLQADAVGPVFERLSKFPVHPGYSNIGEIVEVGKLVNDFAIGDRVATASPHSEFVIKKADACRPIPREIDDNSASLFAIAEIVLAGVRRAKIELGQSIVIYGLGLLGQFAGIFCKLCGAFPVIGVDVSNMRLTQAKANGFDYAINPNECDTIDRIKEITKERMADCVFEVTGNGSLIENELQLLHKQGKLILMSSPRKPTTLNFHDYVNYTSHTIIGAHNGCHPAVATYDNPWTIARDVEVFFDLVSANRLDVSRFITKVFAYKDAPQAYALLLKDKINQLGIVLDWN